MKTIDEIRGAAAPQQQNVFTFSLFEDDEEIVPVSFLCSGVQWDYRGGNHIVTCIMQENEDAVIGNLIKRATTRQSNLRGHYREYDRAGKSVFEVTFERMRLIDMNTRSVWDTEEGEADRNIKRYLVAFETLEIA